MTMDERLLVTVIMSITLTVQITVNCDMSQERQTLLGHSINGTISNGERLEGALNTIYEDWNQWIQCRDGYKFRKRLCKANKNCRDRATKEYRRCCPRKCRLQYRRQRKKNFHIIRDPSRKSIQILGSRPRAKRSGTLWFDLPKGVYSKWSEWAPCSKRCTTERFKWCIKVSICGTEIVKQTAFCYIDESYCEHWVNTWVVNQASEPENITVAPEKAFEAQGRSDSRLTGSPKVSNCGRAKNSSFAPHVSNMLRIIGGRPTHKGRWPWQVAILNRFKEAFCGGTLVADKWVLTAAHCVRRRLFVRLGEHDLAQDEGSELEMRVKKSVIHPSYNSETVDNDVALLRLPRSVSMEQFSTACLPRPRQNPPTDKLCTIIGWGKQSASDPFGTDVLQEAQVPIVPSNLCREVYEDYQITMNMFCAGYRKGRKDSCAGDSGGPLMCQKTSGRWVVFGITSFGEGCAKRGKYGIYTKLSNYVKWIRRIISKTK